MKKKVLLSWSSGKDCAWALQALRQDTSVEVVGLFCMVNSDFDRVATHAVRIALLQQQASSIGLPLHLIEIPYPCVNGAYDRAVNIFIAQAKLDGVEYFAYGDLFLEDVRKYREDSLLGTGITPLFPIWGMATAELSRTMVASGLKAMIVCIDPKRLAHEFVGREFDAAFLDALPANIDPCGENGEFHSFAFDGPMFQTPIAVTVGEVIARDGFVFCAL